MSIVKYIFFSISTEKNDKKKVQKFSYNRLLAIFFECRCPLDNAIPKKSLDTIGLRRQGDIAKYIPKCQVA